MFKCKGFFAIIFLVGIISTSVGIVGTCCINGKIGNLLRDTEATVEDYYPGKSLIRELYGVSSRLLSPHELASENTVTINDDGFLVPVDHIQFDVEAAENKTLQLYNVCKQSGAQFLYVSYPSKASYKDSFAEYGLDGNNYEMRTTFLRGLDEKKIPILNIGEQLQKDGYSIKDIFYKTDHHWKTPMGLYAANSIVNFLNKNFGYSLDQNALQKDRFTYTTYPNLWLGETGRSCSATWTGSLDDFIEIRPTYETEFVFGKYGEETTKKGNFSLFIDDSGYGKTEDLYTYSAHYSYQGDESLTTIHNEYAPQKKILIIKDSFSAVVIPFLSLTASDLIVWDMRDQSDVYTFIQDNDFDLVMLAYTDFWRQDMYDFS